MVNRDTMYDVGIDPDIWERYFPDVRARGEELMRTAERLPELIRRERGKKLYVGVGGGSMPVREAFKRVMHPLSREILDYQQQARRAAAQARLEQVGRMEERAEEKVDIKRLTEEVYRLTGKYPERGATKTQLQGIIEKKLEDLKMREEKVTAAEMIFKETGDPTALITIIRERFSHPVAEQTIQKMQAWFGEQEVRAEEAAELDILQQRWESAPPKERLEVAQEHLEEGTPLIGGRFDPQTEINKAQAEIEGKLYTEAERAREKRLPWLIKQATNLLMYPEAKIDISPELKELLPAGMYEHITNLREFLKKEKKQGRDEQADKMAQDALYELADWLYKGAKDPESLRRLIEADVVPKLDPYLERVTEWEKEEEKEEEEERERKREEEREEERKAIDAARRRDKKEFQTYFRMLNPQQQVAALSRDEVKNILSEDERRELWETARAEQGKLFLEGRTLEEIPPFPVILPKKPEAPTPTAPPPGEVAGPVISDPVEAWFEKVKKMPLATIVKTLEGANLTDEQLEMVTERILDIRPGLLAEMEK